MASIKHHTGGAGNHLIRSMRKTMLGSSMPSTTGQASMFWETCQIFVDKESKRATIMDIAVPNTYPVKKSGETSHTLEEKIKSTGM